MPVNNPTQTVDDVYNIGNLGTSATVDVNNGMWQQGELVTGSSVTVTGYTVDLGVIVLLKITQDGTGGWGITWGGNLIFATNAETQPELGANVTTWFVLWSDVGDSNIYGAKLGGAVSISGDSTGTSSAIVNSYSRGLREAGGPTVLPMGGVLANQYLKDVGGYISGSVPNFLELTDTPSSYSGQGGKYVAVKSDVTGLEFVSASPGGGGSSGLVIYDDNTYKVTGTAISFGSNLSVVITGSIAFVDASNSGGSGGQPIGFYDDSIFVVTGTVVSVNDSLTIASTGTSVFIANKTLIAEIRPYGQITGTFANIPAIYSDLYINLNGRTSTNATSDNFLIFFNQDYTAANYQRERLTGNNAVASAATNASSEIATVAAATATANMAGTATIKLSDYKNTYFHKTARSMGEYRTADGTTIIQDWAAFWENTAAINRIDLVVSGGGSMVTGTVIRLYGEI